MIDLIIKLLFWLSTLYISVWCLGLSPKGLLILPIASVLIGVDYYIGSLKRKFSYKLKIITTISLSVILAVALGVTASMVYIHIPDDKNNGKKNELVFDTLNTDENTEILADDNTDLTTSASEETNGEQTSGLFEDETNIPTTDTIEDLTNDTYADPFENANTGSTSEPFENVSTEIITELIEDISTEVSTEIFEEVNTDLTTVPDEDEITESCTNTIENIVTVPYTETLEETTRVPETTMTEQTETAVESSDEVEVHVHEFSKATCTEPGVCSCGETRGKATGHSYDEDGVCIYCFVADTDSGEEILVWIPTKGGKKYHSHSECSNMLDPEQVTEDEAISLGFEKCKRCH